MKSILHLNYQILIERSDLSASFYATASGMMDPAMSTGIIPCLEFPRFVSTLKVAQLTHNEQSLNFLDSKKIIV